ncbi:MAG: DUF4197 domain-containing protein [Desulfobacteraceae bacterium]|nr:DUF4197 domain-containing protein [Desulfobacteraceae bacterium]
MNRKKKKAVIFVWACLMLTGLFASVSLAGNWLEQGNKLLKSFGLSNQAGELTMGEITAGLKEALKVGSSNVVSQLGRVDGFSADPKIHIPLPASLNKVQSLLSKVGYSHLLDDLELRLNRAAEKATPRAKALFLDAISQMTFKDVKQIYDGPDDAATRYFKGKMSKGLAREMEPIIDESLSQVGAVKAYDNVIREYKNLPFVPDVKSDLTEYVVGKGMDGIFYYVAKEEAAIRNDPTKRTTELLQKVFK